MSDINPYLPVITPRAHYRVRYSGDPAIGWSLRLERARRWWFGFTFLTAVPAWNPPADVHSPAVNYLDAWKLVRDWEAAKLKELIPD